MKKFKFLFFVVILPLVLVSCTSGNQKKNDEFNVAVIRFSHETCTFCPHKTGIEEWEFYGPPREGEEVLSAGPYMRGFVDRCSEIGGFNLTGIYSPRDARGGSSGSWITREAFDKYTHGMQKELKEKGPFDALYLSLHGAMAVEGIPKAEAEIVRRMREVVGDIPVFVTLDLHANEDHELSDVADAVFIVKRYPHYDSYLQGERAAWVLYRTLKGNYKPVMATRKPNVITPSVFQWTGEPPAMEIMERARRWECRKKDVYVSVAFGFAYADVPDAGATVMVVTNNDPALANTIADDMNGYIWRVRRAFAGKKLPGTDEGVKQAMAAVKAGKTPVVIADHADRSGNATHILASLISQHANGFCIATLSDSIALKHLAEEAGPGDIVTVNVGGYGDRFAGDPVTVTGKITFWGKYRQMEPVAVLSWGDNNHLILTPVLHQVIDTSIYRPLGIDPEKVDIFVLKSRVHFRRGYYENGFAKTIILVDAPGMGPADLSKLPYTNLPGDIYPLSGKN